MNANINNIGAVIRDEGIRSGLTKEELGTRDGVSKAQISKVSDKRMIGYVVAVISEFAKAYNMTTREASNYLNRYKGVDFLTEHYEAEHLLSMNDSVQDLARVCYNNGGGML